MTSSYALSWKPCQGDSLNLPDHRIRRRCCSLIPVKSDSLTTCSYLSLQIQSFNVKIVDSTIKEPQSQIKNRQSGKIVRLMIIRSNKNVTSMSIWDNNPALGTLCGCPYSRFKGCVVCGKDTNCVRLSASSKQSYVGHRRYLPYNHPFRKQKKAFNGQQEFLQAPIPMTGEQIYNENVAESIVGTLLHVLGKTKDRLNARLDLAELGGYLKEHVQNRNKPEGCIAEETIAEETIEFFSEYHKSMETISIPPDKHETYENEEGKPLSAKKTSDVSVELFQKAHLYATQTSFENRRIAFLENDHNKSFAKWLREEVEREEVANQPKKLESVSETVRWISYGPRATIVKYDAYNINGYTFQIIVVNLDSSSDNNNSDSYSTSQISTSEEIDYDSPEPPKSLLKWYHYLSDEYKDNGRFWGSKSGCNESDVKPSWKDIEKAKACMLAKAQASEASSKAKVEACGSKVKVEACGSKAKLQASTKTLIVKSPVPITNCVLGLANAKTWDAIKGKTFGVKIQ
ncbi:hypothetical protein Tco_0650893 [Tanacetum coccineum]